MKTDLRLTDTNAASDSKGRTWGLEGGLFWWLVGGIVAGIMVFFVLLVMLKSSLMTSLGVAVLPVGVCLAYIFGLRQGKPRPQGGTITLRCLINLRSNSSTFTGCF